MGNKIFAAAAVTIGLLAATEPARAQIASTVPSTDGRGGWTFAVAPYVWLPTIHTTLNFNTPRSGTITQTISAGIGDYLSKLNFVLFGSAEARSGRFTVFTDLVYANASLTTSNSHFSSFNPGRGPIFIPRELESETGTRLAATVWSLAGGYTVQHGEWGNVDGVLGMRILNLGGTTNLALTQNITLPNRIIAVSRDNSLNLNSTDPEAIFGVKGRFNIPNSRFYVPFYVDVGTGALPLTWQVYTGIAYQVSGWADISAGYRYMGFESGNDTGVHDLKLGGALLAVNCRF